MEVSEMITDLDSGNENIVLLKGMYVIFLRQMQRACWTSYINVKVHRAALRT
jgi:hypothetical protein